MMSKYSKDDWRSTIVPEDITYFYKKKLSVIPRRINGQPVWFKHYYIKYGNFLGHISALEQLTEEEYIVRKIQGLD